MKKIFLLLAAFLLSLVPARAETEVLDKSKVATSYSKVVDGWTYITNAAEFLTNINWFDVRQIIDEKPIFDVMCCFLVGKKPVPLPPNKH